MVPSSLRTWFIVHFAADYLAAVPLFIAPEYVLGMLGWPHYDPIATRIVASAFMAIGGTSFLTGNASLESYRTLLVLKLIWSVAAMIGVLVSSPLGLNGPTLVFAIFFVFFCVWAYYYRQLAKTGQTVV